VAHPEFPPEARALPPSVLPKAIEAPGVHLGLAGRVCDLAVPQVGRQGPRIDALVDEFEPAGMA
jgi:hypothetical protein